MKIKTLLPPTAVKPLRAGKGWLYEGGIRVPLIIKPPDKKTQELTLETPVISMDLYPTILDYLNIPRQPEYHKDGTSLYKLIEKGEEPNRTTLLFHYPHYHGSGWTPGSAIRKGDWKLIHFYESNNYELYNLRDDICENEELSQQYPDKLESLKQELKKNIAETNSRLPIKQE